MSRSRQPTRWSLIVVFVGLSLAGWAQDSSPSLGDVARRARKEHSSASHIPAKQVATEDQDGPDTGGVWRVRQCSQVACYVLSVALPKNPRWIRPAAEPRPVLIPLPNDEDDLSHAIRVYAAESLPVSVGTVDAAKRTFLQAWFSRPQYFGQPAHLLRDEPFPIESGHAKITHFEIVTATKYTGLSVVAMAPNGSYGFACVFQAGDASVATSICDAIVKSARNQVFLTAQKRTYPNYPNPPTYYPRYDDPPDDPPDYSADEDPE